MIRILVIALICPIFILGCESPVEQKSKKVQIIPPEKRKNIVVAPFVASKDLAKILPPKEPDIPRIETLEGKSKDHVALLLGKPDFLRIDTPAQLWQYRHRNCRLNLFFYPSKNGALRLDFFNIRTIDNKNTDHYDCFINIIKANAAASHTP